MFKEGGGGGGVRKNRPPLNYNVNKFCAIKKQECTRIVIVLYIYIEDLNYKIKLYSSSLLPISSDYRLELTHLDIEDKIT